MTVDTTEPVAALDELASALRACAASISEVDAYRGEIVLDAGEYVVWLRSFADALERIADRARAVAA